jgi:superfamily II DNA/RNA helicase
MMFKDLDLHDEILKAIEEAGYTSPTPIQEKAIPSIMAGNDLLATSQTGTGKTAAFILPALNLLTVPSKIGGRGPRLLILVPTRELAIQVAAEALKYSKHLPDIRTVCLYGGVPYPKQNKELSRPYDIIIATPGRLIDQLDRGKINLGRVEMFILDEADRMLDMNFFEPVEEIAKALPSTHQTLLFSATLKGPILKLSKSLLKDPVEIDVQEKAKQLNIEQRMHGADNLQHKHRLLSHLLTDPTLNQAIIFTATKAYAQELVDALIDEGHRAAALHGDMNQRERTTTINMMRQARIRILVATDVAARGIDVPAVTHVINFDLPNNPEDYVHRIGRTGRAGAAGLALSFATHKDMALVKRIEHFTGQKITFHVIKDLEPKARTKFDSSNERSRGSEAPRRSSRPSYGREERNSGGGGGYGARERPSRDGGQNRPYENRERAPRQRAERSEEFSERPKAPYARRERDDSDNNFSPRAAKPSFQRDEGTQENNFSPRRDRPTFPRNGERSERSEFPKRNSRPPFEREAHRNVREKPNFEVDGNRETPFPRNSSRPPFGKAGAGAGARSAGGNYAKRERPVRQNPTSPKARAPSAFPIRSERVQKRQRKNANEGNGSED